MTSKQEGQCRGCPHPIIPGGRNRCQNAGRIVWHGFLQFRGRRRRWPVRLTRSRL